MYGNSINIFNVTDNLKKLINKKNETIFIDNPVGEDIVEQSKEFFSKIYGLNPIKENIYRALLSKDQINILLIGPPATSKTLFMTIIQERCNEVCYFDAANTSGAGFIEFLYNHQKSKILIIDEIDKLKKNDLNSLIGVLNNGKINKNLKNISYNFTIKCKILATSNSNTKLTKPMRSRFQEYHLPEYSDEEYIKVVKFCLSKNTDLTISEAIAKILLAHKRKDVRAAISISNLLQTSDTVEDIVRVVDTWINYKSHELIDYN